MKLWARPEGIAIAALLGLVVGACTPQAPHNGSSQADVSPQMAENVASDAIAPAPAVESIDNSPASKENAEAIGESTMATNGASGGIYVARLKKALAIPLLAPTGTVLVKNGCLVATIDGVDHLAILPPQGRLIGPPNAPTSIKLSRRLVPLGKEVSLPAGGAEFSLSDLQSPIPGTCPRKGIVFAG